MAERFQHEVERRSDNRHSGGWPVIVSAWALVLLVLVVLAGVHAAASLRGASHPDGRLEHAVIPRHNPACGGWGFASLPASEGCEPVPFGEDRSAYW